MERAKQILGAVVHPVEQKQCPLSEMPWEAQQPDFDLETSLEESPFLLWQDQAKGGFPATSQDLWMTYQQPKRQSLILSVDTSLSMTGEKLALTAVALAVVLLEFPDDPVGIIAFENEAKILKTPTERISIQTLVERFLDVPAQGYTHLESGLASALKLTQTASEAGIGSPPSTILLSDGKYTAGKDPAYLAPRFHQLIVLKMGKEKSSLPLCKELAQKGRGSMKEIDDLEDLPEVMYSVVKDLLRR